MGVSIAEMDRQMDGQSIQTRKKQEAEEKAPVSWLGWLPYESLVIAGLPAPASVPAMLHMLDMYLLCESMYKGGLQGNDPTPPCLPGFLLQ